MFSWEWWLLVALTVIPLILWWIFLDRKRAYEIGSESGGDTLTITLTPPSPTTVRTGATAIFEINGRLPVAIVAQARDRAGNTTNLPQFDIRGPETGAVCR